MRSRVYESFPRDASFLQRDHSITFGDWRIIAAHPVERISKHVDVRRLRRLMSYARLRRGGYNVTKRRCIVSVGSHVINCMLYIYPLSMSRSDRFLFRLLRFSQPRDEWLMRAYSDRKYRDYNSEEFSIRVVRLYTFISTTFFIYPRTCRQTRKHKITMILTMTMISILTATFLTIYQRQKHVALSFSRHSVICLFNIFDETATKKNLPCLGISKNCAPSFILEKNGPESLNKCPAH